MTAPGPRPPLTDSPWFWLYVFAAAALAALFLAGPKFQVRQAQVERNLQARERAVQSLSGQAPDVPLSEVGRTRLTLRPLFLIAAAAAMVGWTVLWWRRFRRPGACSHHAPRDERHVAHPSGFEIPASAHHAERDGYRGQGNPSAEPPARGPAP